MVIDPTNDVPTDKYPDRAGEFGECATCGREYEFASDMDVCPACCDHDGDITVELTQNTCETCHTAVVETADGWETSN